MEVNQFKGHSTLSRLVLGQGMKYWGDVENSYADAESGRDAILLVLSLKTDVVIWNWEKRKPLIIDGKY